MQAVSHRLPPSVLPQHYGRQSLIGANANGAGPSSVITSPSLTTRKRKRANDYTISYSEVQEVDDEGRLREVIVIDDTPPPTMSPATTHTAGFSASFPPLYSAPIRTRARAAAEAQALSASSSSAAVLAPAQKRRKRDQVEPVRALPSKKAAPSTSHITQTKSYDSRSAAATDDVCSPLPFSRHPQRDAILQTSKGPVTCDDKEGHYIIVPDDMIYRRCRCHLSHEQL